MVAECSPNSPAMGLNEYDTDTVQYEPSESLDWLAVTVIALENGPEFFWAAVCADVWSHDGLATIACRAPSRAALVTSVRAKTNQAPVSSPKISVRKTTPARANSTIETPRLPRRRGLAGAPDPVAATIGPSMAPESGTATPATASGRRTG